ncbi:MAG: hypothetical protein LBQ00_01440 [Syntrophobacterales bacterium]|nr:hypothetical protein [Syntrophobacterales bacterium]
MYRQAREVLRELILVSRERIRENIRNATTVTISSFVYGLIIAGNIDLHEEDMATLCLYFSGKVHKLVAVAYLQGHKQQPMSWSLSFNFIM